jgi:hypothetical protein
MGLIDESQPEKITEEDCSGQKHVPSNRGERRRRRNRS